MKSKLLLGLAALSVLTLLAAMPGRAQEAPEFCSTGDLTACDDGDACTFDFCRSRTVDSPGGGIGFCIHSPIDGCAPEPSGCAVFGEGSVDFQCCQAGFDLDANPTEFKCCEESVSQGGAPQACEATPKDPPPPETVPAPPAPPPAPPPADPVSEPDPPAASEPSAPSTTDEAVCGNGSIEPGEECDGGPACDVNCRNNIAAFPDCRIPSAELRALAPFELIAQYGRDDFEKCARIGGGGGAGLDRFDPKTLPSNGAGTGGCSLILEAKAPKP